MVKEHVGGGEKISDRTRGPLHSSLNCVLITREITDRRRQQKFLLLITRIKIGAKTWGALKTWGRFSYSVFITIASDRKALWKNWKILKFLFFNSLVVINTRSEDSNVQCGK